MLTDYLIGRGGLDKIREYGEDYANSAYDPSQVDPLVDQSMDQSVNGIDVDTLRRQMLSKVYRDAPSMNYGMSQGQQIASNLLQDQGRFTATAIGENQIGLQDESVKREGKLRLSEALAKREQLKAKRDAAIAENRMKVEAEAGKRKMQLLGGIMNLATAAIDPSMITSVFNSLKSGEDESLKESTGGFVF